MRIIVEYERLNGQAGLNEVNAGFEVFAMEDPKQILHVRSL